MSTIVEVGGRASSRLHLGDRADDGLRYDAATNQIWSLRNRGRKCQSRPGHARHSREVGADIDRLGERRRIDDILFQGGNTFISASNPAMIQNAKTGDCSGDTERRLSHDLARTHGQCDCHALQHQFKRNFEPPGSRQPVADCGMDRPCSTSQGDGELVFVRQPRRRATSRSASCSSKTPWWTIRRSAGQQT